VTGRLGIYVDAVYRRTPRPDGAAQISSDRAFLLFACEVGSHFDELVLLGRTLETDAPAEYVLPPDARLVALPHYENLLRLGQVVRALPGTIRAMWRGLGRVDTVWVIGPNPFDPLLIGLALLRGRRVALGVRQDTPAYYRSRVPGRHWTPAVWAMDGVDAVYRLLARRLPTVVVGNAIADRYAGGTGRSTVHPITVTLVRERDLVTAPPAHDWSGPLRLVTVGRLEREKNPLLLVEALAELQRRSGGRFHLTWVGRGPLEAPVRDAAERLGVATAIDVRGYVPFGPELYALYRGAHAFVHVSLTEGVPQVIVEALASGTPVVATDVGGVRGAFGDAVALVPPRSREALVEAVLHLAADPVFRDDLVARGLALARTLTLEAEAARVAGIVGAVSRA
jgi:glycosyltransferase involved in cell wall biosynthesis